MTAKQNMVLLRLRKQLLTMLLNDLEYNI